MVSDAGLGVEADVGFSVGATTGGCVAAFGGQIAGARRMLTLDQERNLMLVRAWV